MPTTKSAVIQRLIDHVTSECNEIDAEQKFRDALDELYSFDSVGGPFEHLQPSRVLEEMDPTAFRCGVADHSDSQQWTDIEGNYYEPREVESAREEFIDELKSELKEIEDEIADLEESATEGVEDTWSAKLAELNPKAAQLRAEIEEAEGYTF